MIVESFGTGFGLEGGFGGLSSSCKGCVQKAGLGFEKRVSEAPGFTGFRETSRTPKRLEIEGASSNILYALHVNAERCLIIRP